ncbi:MAG: aminotransferase class III-fold pyridoxal phosphate-dependent enzyme, partial [Pseudomonadales bacterium]|nr:aminotransferase class III-fold pyridoxal phosphate-dependent enzyme [Pseudomonadales bacterium]
MTTYNRLPVSFARGEGCWLFDQRGKRYLDALCGISVTNLGHTHPAVTETISRQANTLLHTSNLYQIDAQEQLAAQLCDTGTMQRVFFANSGAEANEAAIKLARLHAHNRGNQNPLIVTLQGSFHGRTLATIAATGNASIREGFGPDLPGFVHLPLNDLAAAEALFAGQDNIAAVLIEPVQGEGGIHIAAPAYLKQLQQLCHQHGALFMLDEIQTGNGRCGRYFAYQLYDGSEHELQPDVVTTAKGLGNGIPIGACLARGAAADVMAPGKHGSTFGGNPFACSVA